MPQSEGGPWRQSLRKVIAYDDVVRGGDEVLKVSLVRVSRVEYFVFLSADFLSSKYAQAWLFL